MRVAILGGTGSFGRALAARLALGGDDVVIGSRDEERARETAAELGGAGITGATNEQAVAGVDLVVLAVNADAALDTARSLAGALGATPLLSVASAIKFRKAALLCIFNGLSRTKTEIHLFGLLVIQDTGRARVLSDHT